MVYLTFFLNIEIKQRNKNYKIEIQISNNETEIFEKKK